MFSFSPYPLILIFAGVFLLWGKLFAQNEVVIQSVGSGSVSGGGSYSLDSVCEILATPDSGFEFIGWSGDLAGDKNPYSFHVKSSISAFAHFQKKKNQIIYIDGKPALAGSFVAKLNENGRRSLKRRVNRVGSTTVFRRNKILDDLVKIDLDTESKLFDSINDQNLSASTLAKFSQNKSKVKSAGVSLEIKKMIATNHYEYVEPNWIIQKFSSKYFEAGYQWGLRNIQHPYLQGILGLDVRADEAWALTANKSGPIVAVIDTGVDYTHPDLANNMWVNGYEIPGNGIDDDLNGYIDDIHGINVNERFDATGDPMDSSTNSHGTHVAGIIAANGSVLGLAPNSKIMALSFFDFDDAGTIDQSVRCIDYAIANGAKIINASYGGYASNANQRKVEKDAIDRALERGVIFIAAAGNDGVNNDQVNSFVDENGNLQVGRAYPASHEQENVISVASVDSSGSLVDSSNFGPTHVDLAAPGNLILSTVRNQGWTLLSGTSMAAPFVSAAAALLLTLEPDLTPAEVKQRIISNVTPLDSLAGKTVSGGMLNAHHVLEPPPVLPLVLDITYSPETPETGQSFELSVTVTGPDPVLGASVSATMGNSAESYTLLDNGAGIDLVADDGTYSMLVYAPELPAFDLNISVSAAGREPTHRILPITTLTRPPNDNLAQALPLNPDLSQTEGFNTHATLEDNETLFEQHITHTVWYTWQPTQSGDARLSTFGSDFDTTLAIYQKDGTGALQLVGSNDDAGEKQFNAEVLFEADSSVLYYLQIGGKFGESGDFVINHPQPELPKPEILPPVILTEFQRLSRVEGESLEIIVELAGTAPFEYRWTRDGKPLPRIRENSLSLANLKVADSGLYQLQASNEGGQTMARILDLLVVPKQEISLQVVVNPRSPVSGEELTIHARPTTDLGALLGANIEATIDDGTPIQLLDNGTGADNLAEDGVYSARSTTPETSSFELTVSASANNSVPTRTTRTVQTIRRPENDAFANALLLDNETHLTQANNALATTEPTEPLFTDGLAHTLWFLWQPASSGVARLSTTGSAGDTTLAVFTGTSLDNLSTVATGDDLRGNAKHAEVVFKARENTSYLLQVGSKSGTAGKIRLHHPAPKVDKPTLLPPKILTRPSELSKTEGESFSTNVRVTGSQPMTYQWSVNGRPIPGANQSTYVSLLLGLSDSGVYSVTVSNEAGHASLPLINLTIRPSRETAPNDMVENAQPIAGNRARKSAITRNATGQRGEPNHAGVSTPLHSVWWKWKAQKSGQVKLSTAGSSFDTTLSAYRLLEGSEADNRRADDPGQQIASFTAPSSENDLSVTLPGHGFAIGQVVEITGVAGHSTESAKFLISSVDGDSFSLSGTANMNRLSLTPESRAKIIK
jgi:subtilisin family serine protease